ACSASQPKRAVGTWVSEESQPVGERSVPSSAEGLVSRFPGTSAAARLAIAQAASRAARKSGNTRRDGTRRGRFKRSPRDGGRAKDGSRTADQSAPRSGSSLWIVWHRVWRGAPPV